MNTKDIDIFIKAKRNAILPNVLLCLAFLLICAFVLLELASVEHDFTLLIPLMALAFWCMAFGTQKWALVPRNELINIIERQINKDSEAIKYLSSKCT